MLFNSWKFLLFFPVVTFVYFLISKKYRYLWLLFASYFFYMCWNPGYIFLIGISTIITYLSGIWIERYNQKKKVWAILSFILNLGILFFFKYFWFAFRNLTFFFHMFQITLPKPQLDLLLPVGISFYTFQALSYTVDVYRKQIKAEKNFFRYALFVSFFPQLVAGPIERSGNLLKQIKNGTDFDWNHFRDGCLYMLWGFFEKIVIADRIGILVDSVYNNYTSYGGFQIFFATVLFAFQVYCDFSGYTDIAIGAAKVLGFHLMQNFRQPYFSKSVAEFWRRWHISLSTWFKDYLYIPLGGNRHGRWKKYRNLMIVFLVSGLWHGASWNFVIWGGLHGIYQIMGSLLSPWKQGVIKKTHMKTGCFSFRLAQNVITFLLVDFAWLFFRASGGRQALQMIKYSLLHMNPFALINGGLYNMGLNQKNMNVLMFSLSILFLVDYLRIRGGFMNRFLSQNKWFYYGVSYCGLLFILFFGIYGTAYNPAQFLYFQF